MLHLPILSLLIWLPVVGAVVALFLRDQPRLAWWLSIFIAGVCVALCFPLYFGFDGASYHMQFLESHDWIKAYGIKYSLGVDGISMPLVVLTTLTTMLVVLAAWHMVTSRRAEYLASFLLMQAMVVGVFSAVDSILFYCFWEGMLIPMYLSIGIWGGAQRSYAAIKFFLYTFVGSALLLVAILFLHVKSPSNSWSIIDWQGVLLSDVHQEWLFWAFLLAFAIKVPMWPLHTWLPDAHTEAPTGGSVVLAALMLKVGGYGFFRFNLPIVPFACQHYDWILIALSLIAIVYVGFVALAQTDMKKLIAYSSISHMGFVTLGIFMIFVIMQQTGSVADAHMALEGALVQMFTHAFGAGALFLGFGILYEQMHTRNIKDFGGIAKTMPVFAAFFMLFSMSNAGLPGTSGFVGEFMVLLSTFKASFWVTFVAGLTIIISAAYTLWMFKRVFFGKINNDAVNALQDINRMEWCLFVGLALGILAIGLVPNILVSPMHGSVEHLLSVAHLLKEAGHGLVPVRGGL